MKILERLVRHVDHHLASPHDAPLATLSSPEEIRRHLGQRYDFSEAIPAEEVFEDVASLLRLGTEHATHPRHFGLFRTQLDRGRGSLGAYCRGRLGLRSRLAAARAGRRRAAVSFRGYG